MLPAEAEITVTEQHPGRRRPARAGVAVGYHLDGDLVGLVAVNAPQAFTAITRTMLAGAGARFAPAAPIRPALASVPPRAALPAPAGPPPISGPLPLGPQLYAVR